MEYGFYTEVYPDRSSIQTLQTGDGKSVFTEMVYDKNQMTAIGFSYGMGNGTGNVLENTEGLDHRQMGIKWQVRFNCVESIDALISRLQSLRVRQKIFDETRGVLTPTSSNV